MKVIAINGSPRPGGNTQFALTQVKNVLQEEGISCEIIQVGGKHIRGCMNCKQCVIQKNEQCALAQDDVNDILQQMKQADGIIIAAPVYYSGIAGTMKCLLDRIFTVSDANDNLFRHKIGAALVAVRRTGGTMTLNGLNQYLQTAEMIIPSSKDWNIIYGRQVGDAEHDTEGIQVMQTLGRNMANAMKLIHHKS